MYTKQVYSPYVNSFDVNQINQVKKQFDLVTLPPIISRELHVEHIFNIVMQRIFLFWNKTHKMNCLVGIDYADLTTKCILFNRYNKINPLNFWVWKHRISKQIILQIKEFIWTLKSTKLRFTLNDSFNIVVNNAFVKLWNKGLVISKKKLLWWDCGLQTTLSEMELGKKKGLGCWFGFKYVLLGTKLKWNGRWILNNYITLERSDVKMKMSKIIINLNDISFIKFKSNVLIDPISLDYIDILVNVDCEHNLDVIDDVVRFSRNLLCISNKDLTLPIIKWTYVRAGICYYSKNKEIDVYFNKKTNSNVKLCLSNQWYVRLSLLKNMSFINNYKSLFKDRLDQNLKLWCISRFIDWGHKLPVLWNGTEVIINDSITKAKYYAILYYALTFVKTKTKFTQEISVFDTWFSSALWYLACLGWPHKTIQLRTYYGKGTIFTGIDITFSWVIKIILISSLLMNERIPFERIIIHPVICDSRGDRMLETKGNVVSPSSLLNTYGLGVLGLYFSGIEFNAKRNKINLNSIILCNDILNKLWNINCIDADERKCVGFNICHWILSSIYCRHKKMIKFLNTFEFSKFQVELMKLIKYDVKSFIAIHNCQKWNLIKLIVKSIFSCWVGGTPKHNLSTYLRKNYFMFGSILKLVNSFELNKVRFISNGSRLFKQVHFVLKRVSPVNVLFFRRLRITSDIGIILWNNTLILIHWNQKN
ncbi:Valine--tRNA ligase [Candidatus Hodgkinia cicadicola]|uniref:valine--tRNA ligase n=1 Tax=Candidatus Hodgkinia cicadicola TaxID=573658 RepID=A0ABX4MF32_9HYPH|nr:Valine--tRNA ligase [Candidatus Hodgkinia cicadicola]